MLQAFAERTGISYPLLSDPNSDVIRAFGILNDTVPGDSFVRGVPYPGTYVIDSAGIVEAKYFEEKYQERYTAGKILVERFRAATGETHAAADNRHLRLVYWASNRKVSVGQRVELVLDVDLKPKMHVYAPGVEGGYIPIAWDLTSADGWTVHPAAYPESKSLHLPAINETVPVYEGSVRIVRDITLGLAKEVEPLVRDGKLTVKGAFRYQACDDRMCYRPESIPVEWTFDYVPMDRTRAPEQLRR